MYILLAILFVTISIIFLFSKHRNKNEKLGRPIPGPRGIPIIGNLHQFDPMRPHECLADLAKTYGPILGLRFGRVPVVAVQSAKLAKEVLQTRDLSFSNRPPLKAMRRMSYYGLDIIGSSNTEYYREMKKNVVIHLLSSKRVDSFVPIVQDEVEVMMKKISSLSSASQVVNLNQLITIFASSTICKIAFGKSYENEDGSNSRFEKLLIESEALFITFFFSNCFPFCGWLDVLAGNTARLERTFKKVDEFCDEIINDHLDPNKPKSERDNIIDVLLNLMKENTIELTLVHIKALLVDIFIAGADTSSLMVIWAMTELTKNPDVMEKVQREIRDEIGDKDFVTINDLPKLKYFKALVKETFRLHPAAPLLIPHYCVEGSTIDGYDILPNTLVFINAWAIGRDPKTWPEPERFMPERFMESSIDYKGNDFELIPFGAGRRMCPGMNLGVINMELALANLLYAFDWELPPGLTKEDIDTEGIAGLAMHKKNHLCLMAKKF